MNIINTYTVDKKVIPLDGEKKFILRSINLKLQLAGTLFWDSIKKRYSMVEVF